MHGNAATIEQPTARIVESGFAMKVFYAFAALAALSVLISLAGRMIGSNLAAVGHTEDRRRVEVVIGNNVFSIPANMIRAEEARRGGDARRIDLYALWPSMEGYSNARREAFNNRTATRRIVFMSVEPRMMSRDMSGRLEPIYRRLIDLPGQPGPAGLRVYNFAPGSGYTDELLVVGERPGRESFVARCLSGAAAAESLAGCERDVHVGEQLSLSYRFPEEMLESWEALDAAVSAKVAEMLKTAR